MRPIKNWQRFRPYPLRSSPITGPSTLILDDPPPCFASVLSFSWDLHLNFSLNIETTGSHVPHKSLTQIHATFTPEAAWAVNRFPPNLSRTQYSNPVLTSSLIEWFAYARLSESHLPRSYAVTFPKTLTTLALYQRSFRWFEACSCKPASRGPPSSFAQLRTLYIKVRSWRTILR